MLHVVLAILAWGVFPFGAVHPWAYWTLLTGCALGSLWIWRYSVHPVTWPSARAITIAALVLVPVALQLVPLSQALVDEIAPATHTFLQQLDPRYLFQGSTSHPLSVAPARTLVCVVFLAIGLLWVASLSVALSDRLRPSELARRIMWLAVVVAVLGLAQKATFNGKIYWFWESRFGVENNYFGPFVNRNHFAGWMLLALTLSTGHLLGLLAEAMPRSDLSWRDRVLWLGSRSAGDVASTATALAVLATSLVWTLSRSGIAATGCALTILGLAAAKRQTGKTRRTIAASFVFIGVASVLAWRGIDAVASWYADTHTFEWRVALWNDSFAALRDFFIFGSGLNTYGTVMLLYPQSDARVHAQQAHNDYLQFAIEGGLLVGIPVLIATFMLIHRVWSKLRQPQEESTWWIRLGATTGIVGVAIQELTEFSLQIPGVAVLFAVAVAIAIHEPARQSAESRRRHRRVVVSV